MNVFGVRVLVSGYAIAGLAATATHMAGFGVVAAVLVAWLGGALCTLALGVLAAACGLGQKRQHENGGADSVQAGAAWERDRLADRADARSADKVGRDTA
jgi:hypothetical protein